MNLITPETMPRCEITSIPGEFPSPDTQETVDTNPSKINESIGATATDSEVTFESQTSAPESGHEELIADESQKRSLYILKTHGPTIRRKGRFGGGDAIRELVLHYTPKEEISKGRVNRVHSAVVALENKEMVKIDAVGARRIRDFEAITLTNKGKKYELAADDQDKFQKEFSKIKQELD